MEGYNFFPCPSNLQFSFERNEEFERMPDTNPGPGHWREFVEQSAGAKRSAGKKESEVRYMVSISNRDYAGRGDLDQGRFGKRALFKRRLRRLRLKADTSRFKTC